MPTPHSRLGDPDEMTVSTEYAPLIFPGNNVTTQLPVTWQFFSDSLVVTEINAAGVESQKSITTHYTVSGGTDADGLPGTGTVTLGAAHAIGTRIRVERATPMTQEATWGENDAFPQKTVEAVLDRAILIAQETAFLDGGGTPQVRTPYIELIATAVPDSPSVGLGRLYQKSDGYLYHKNSDGTEVNLSAQGVLTDAVEDAEAAAAAALSYSQTASGQADTATTQASAASAAAAAAAATSGAFTWNYDISTSMADPGSGDIRLDHATFASVTAIAVSDNSADSGSPDVSPFVLAWDDSTNAHKGTMTLRKKTAPNEFVVYAITGASTDNSGWTQLAVAHVVGNPAWSDADPLLVSFVASGNVGASGAGSGDMLAATYDPANISEQVVGLTATQTLTNKTLTSPTINAPTMTAPTLGAASATSIAVGNTGLVVGASTPFSDSSGTLTLQNVDALDATTEATIEAAIDTLANLASIQGVSFTFGAYAATLLNTANEAAFKAAVNLEVGIDVQAYDADTLKADTTDDLTAGFTSTSVTQGTKSSGTFTPAFSTGNVQHYVNGGAHTLAPPSSGHGSIVIDITNSASAGAITTSGFTRKTGDSFTTTDGHKFRCFISVGNIGSHLHVTAFQ